MNRRTKKIVLWIVGGVVGVIALVLVASWVYVEFIKDDPPAEFTIDDVLDAVTTSGVPTIPADTSGAGSTAATTAPVESGDPVEASLDTSAPTATEAPTTVETATAEPTAGVDGVWTVTQESTLRYRVTESINGFDTEGVGSTNAVTGSLTLSGTTATAADFTVDMTTFTSDESRRDGQFRGRIMSVDEFPTSSFVLTSPIEFATIPAAGETITATATGDLTLRGVTRSVTFEVTATLDNGRIGVLGNIPVLFSDYGIPNPSFGTITTEDNGLLEFILVFVPST
jgi:polyisoprenoid-binding protein YceI